MCTHVCMSVCVHANPSLTKPSLFFSSVFSSCRPRGLKRASLPSLRRPVTQQHFDPFKHFKSNLLSQGFLLRIWLGGLGRLQKEAQKTTLDWKS